MNTLDVIRTFARDLLREPLWHCGQPDAWERVAHAATAEQVAGALHYCAGYADAIRTTRVLGEPLYYAADVLGIAARTLLLALSDPSIRVGVCAATYRAELHDIMRRVAA